MEVGVPKASGGGGLFGLFGGGRGAKLEVDAAMPAVEIKGKGKLPDAKLEVDVKSPKLDVKAPKVEVKAPKVDVKLPKVDGKVDIKVRPLSRVIRAGGRRRQKEQAEPAGGSGREEGQQ